MRDRPDGARLVALAREILVEELVPLLPAEARIKARLVATCMAIAGREAEAGFAPLAEIDAALRQFYATEGEGEGEALLRRFASDLRRGAFDAEPSQQRAARAILWRMVVVKLREGNPAFLAANGLDGG